MSLELSVSFPLEAEDGECSSSKDRMWAFNHIPSSWDGDISFAPEMGGDTVA